MKQNSKNNKEIWKTAWHILNPSAATIKRNINEINNTTKITNKFLDTANFIKLLPEKFTDKTVYAVTKKHWGSTKNNKKHI